MKDLVVFLIVVTVASLLVMSWYYWSQWNDSVSKMDDGMRFLDEMRKMCADRGCNMTAAQVTRYEAPKQKGLLGGIVPGSPI